MIKFLIVLLFFGAEQSQQDRAKIHLKNLYFQVVKYNFYNLILINFTCMILFFIIFATCKIQYVCNTMK